MEHTLSTKKSAILLAHYLPQFHIIPENNKWWGDGFTEWTNVKKARPMFIGHKQPIVPGSLGYYNLLNPAIREQQAKLAQDHGITGFAYWHYWFGNGKQLLEQPFNEVLESGSPDFPFCLAWANESWTGTWHGLDDEILMEQKYPGPDDYVQHFNHVLKAFRDSRYIKVENKPLFIVYLPYKLPNANEFTSLWNKLAKENGYDGIYFIGIHYIGWDHKKDGFDGKSVHPLPQYVDMFEMSGIKKRINYHLNRFLRKPEKTYRYRNLINSYDTSWLNNIDCIPSLLANWDNTPRTGKKGWVVQGPHPKLFRKHFKEVLEYVINSDINPHNVILLKSWNEWAEGNYLEPDKKWGPAYLAAINNVLASLNVETGKSEIG